MKRAAILWLLLAGLSLWAGPALAQKTYYVSDRMQITVRTGPSTENRVIEMISSGDEVTLLEETPEGWARVQTRSGKDGWVLRRFLIDDKPAVLKLKDQSPQDRGMTQRLEEANRAAQEAGRNQAQAEARAQEAETKLAQLQSDCTEVIKLRDDFAKLQEEYQQQSQNLEELGTENESLRFGTNLKWFLAGGGVLVLGWIMGLAFGRRKRRWTSNLH